MMIKALLLQKSLPWCLSCQQQPPRCQGGFCKGLSSARAHCDARGLLLSAYHLTSAALEPGQLPASSFPCESLLECYCELLRMNPSAECFDNCWRSPRFGQMPEIYRWSRAITGASYIGKQCLLHEGQEVPREKPPLHCCSQLLHLGRSRYLRSPFHSSETSPPYSALREGARLVETVARRSGRELSHACSEAWLRCRSCQAMG